ncbi:hypothetical protein [Rhizobium leguminosarum]|uniref:hypothetical protein n=1 Tax=Rhizobium leguminosarum TaxID=384 RepID=UPI0013B9B533|nr:hypothetical protein [Rhizobium leguminosarum]MBY5385220.1 hypothetical protein [Rhizobium leguminosarum]NEH73978.1 hypothetical protein [Rhizobium leguminosarum]
MSEWRMKWREALPLGLYSALTIGGMIFIMTAKMLGWSPLVVSGVPVGLMAFYFVCCLGILPGLRLHSEQAGDNLYYMGFLFTLTSLGTSLYRFTAGASIDDIVQNFGVAVSSTIVGVALRIFFNQMRRDPLDVDRTVRHELADMTRRVKTELNSSAREFSSYRRISSQMLTEGFAEIAKQAERNGEAILKSLEGMTKDAIRPIQEAATQLAVIAEANNKIVEERAKANAEMADAAITKLDAAANRLAEIVVAFGDQVETAGNRLAGMRLPEEVLKVELQPILTAVTELGSLQTERLDEAANANAVQTERMKDALAPLLTLPERLDNSFRPLADFSKKLDQSFQPLDELSKNLERSLAPVAELPTRLSNSLQVVDGLGEKIKSALKPLAKTAAKLDASVASLDEAAQRVSDSARTLPIYGATVSHVSPAQETTDHTNAFSPTRGENSIELPASILERPIPTIAEPLNTETLIGQSDAAAADHETETDAKKWWKWQ